MSQPTPHETYMGMTFRPLVKADGSVGMVGVQFNSPACCDPEMFPNLLMSSPVMYQALSIILSKFPIGSNDREFIETVMAFAIDGYLVQSKMDDILKKMKGV